MEDKKIDGKVETVVVETAVVKVEAKKSFVGTLIGFGKRHGQKIATGMALAGVGALGYVMGKRAGILEAEENMADGDYEVTTFDYSDSDEKEN